MLFSAQPHTHSRFSALLIVMHFLQRFCVGDKGESLPIHQGQSSEEHWVSIGLPSTVFSFDFSRKLYPFSLRGKIFGRGWLKKILRCLIGSSHWCLNMQRLAFSTFFAKVSYCLKAHFHHEKEILFIQSHPIFSAQRVSPTFRLNFSFLWKFPNFSQKWEKSFRGLRKCR